MTLFVLSTMFCSAQRVACRLALPGNKKGSNIPTHTTSTIHTHTHKHGMKITVQTLSGKAIPIDVAATDTVDDVKEQITEIEGVPPAQQRLVYEGQQIRDGTVSDHDIDGTAPIHLIHALK